MNGEQKEIQFLGFFGIFKEAFNIISSYRKIFIQITLSVILPLSFINLSQHVISEYLFGEITPGNNVMDDTQIGSQKYSTTSNIFSSELTTYWLFKIAFVIFSIILSLLSTSAVVYTIACIYTGKEISYKRVMKVVPKVWKRLMITFLWNFIILFAFIMGASIMVMVILFLWVLILEQNVTAIFTIAIILFVLSMLGISYMSFIWQLANVISVLEEVYGIQALMKSKNLIKGNTGLCAAIFLINTICSLGIDQGFKASIVGVDSVWGRMLHAYLWSWMMSVLILYALVNHTIIYFICKSHHHENIDKLSLANHLEVYHRDYVLLDSKNVHMQLSRV